ncbi:carotenoid oxygenase family protein [Hyalangium rubrum]|uniref:Carotenoid oxygenase family protein n=1 Tax=Hyalangium rubrum TaxID=3103134 RepID=A0ABU5HBS1_9BACT|nr:carotenoid oxygenase family protein [Hyalangium sp. s54d21]MDY7229525.1 carotenoid oxygenase family protein [Hyalangium sp. s54d21]
MSTATSEKLHPDVMPRVEEGKTTTSVSLAFTSLNTETDIARLPTEGHLPDWLSGSLYRNGPAKFEHGDASYRHWFDGLAMVHRYTFDHGKVSYRNRFLRTTPYEDMLRTGQLSAGFEATQPSTLASRVFNATLDLLGRRDNRTFNTNVNVVQLAGKVMALTEQPVPTLFDGESLRTEGAFHYDDDLFGHLSCGHPQYDIKTGYYYNYLTRFGLTHSYNLYKVHERSTRRTLVATIPVSEPAYMHSFAITENYIVLTEFPLVFNPMTALLSGKAPKDCLRWKPERGTQFRVIHKHTGAQVAHYESEAFFAFHHINAYEQAGDIIVDIAATDEPELMRKSYLKPLRAATRSEEHPLSEYHRYCLPLSTRSGGALSYELLSEHRVEMVTVNAGAHNGRHYRYAYGVSHNTRWHNLVGQLVKADVERRTSRVWFEPNTYPNEPIFVAAPGATREDEGVILSVVLDTARARSFLLVLDAASFRELGRAHLPHHIPLEFHGTFVPAPASRPGH